jgi:hypothetical protein
MGNNIQCRICKKEFLTTRKIIRQEDCICFECLENEERGNKNE